MANTETAEGVKSPSPSVVFEQFLKAAVHALKHPCSVRARIQLTVVGDGGGDWTVDLRRFGAYDVIVGPTDDPELQIILQRAFLGQFLTGDYDLGQAIAAGQLGIVGSHQTLVGFLDFLIGRAPKTNAAEAGLSKPTVSGVGIRDKRGAKR